MRVCPECGYVDPPEWRHSRFSYWLDICYVDDFERLNPELGKKLRKAKRGFVVEDKDYWYRIGKNGVYVERKAKIDLGNANQWREKREKARRRTPVTDFRSYWRIDPIQRKIGEFLNAP